jgi:branched-chain amino acid aminotransferase
MDVIRLPHPSPTPDHIREQLIADPGFGTVFTDHMVVIDYDEALGGWQTPTLSPREAIPLDPAASVLHYAQEIFEGLKAYRHPDGRLGLFRPEANAARFNASADRLAMPHLPPALFLGAIAKLLEVDGNWYPAVEGGSLYLRPFMIATEAFLGVRPAKQYKFIVIASPAGNYFKSGAKAVSIWISDYTRAAPGGTGAAKCGGNYAASLVPTGQAFAMGHDQVLFLDAAKRKWVEELGGMNLFFVFANGTVITPPLTGTILPGITRDSLMTLLAQRGLKVSEAPYSIDQWRADAASGHLIEVLACGTAAVVTAVGTVAGPEGGFTIGAGGIGQTTAALRETLVGIQTGRIADSHGWVMRV